MTRPGQGDALAAWALFAAVTLAVLVTYSRLEPSELYTSRTMALRAG